MLTELLQTYAIPVALHALLAAAVWLVGRWLAKRSRGWLARSLQNTDLTESFITLIMTVSYYGILILAALLALATLGVPVTILGGALSVVGIVLAIALRTSLGNLAGTVLIQLFKPFMLGDVIQAGGALGVVREIQMFSTVLHSPDGKTHIVPNGVIQGGGMTNWSTIGVLRLDLSFQISYESDLAQAKAILANLLASDERVLAEPPTQVFVQQLTNNGVEVVAWPFAKVDDFASLQAELVERVRREFDKAGIVMPYPRQDVHLYTHN